MSNVTTFSLVYIIGVIISSFAQILLKKSADDKKDNIIKEYLNPRTVFAYFIFFMATLCTVIAYKYIPLSYGPILGTLEYVFVAVLSYLLLKERIKKKKLLGILLVLLGIFIYSL